ncbi:metalloproteinase inhibitor 1-like [Ochotona princeps]|uniref:metalloproteinase inhibitor 1-like n=1 Tax=Ochotona princeps TaxID=9978 RepID=UPI00271520DC|nr:metalloproteinase inhibitor 1-like [Ochotona princeps]
MESSFLLVFPLLLALSTPGTACKCKLLHPQTYYCASDIVILANIARPAKNIGNWRGFKIQLIRIFKAPPHIIPFDVIYTPLDYNSCGYLVKTSYQTQLLIAGYLAGGKMTFNRCHMVHHWLRLSSQQRLGFQGGYNSGCNCNIERCTFCWRDCPEPSSTDCVWKQDNCKYDSWTGTHSMYSLCVRSGSNQCNWDRQALWFHFTTVPATTPTTPTPPSTST